MAKIFVKNWKLGTESESLKFGEHKNKSCRSVVVYAGEVVTFDDSIPFYQGEYFDLSFYGIHQHHDVIRVRPTSVTAGEMIEIGNGVNFKGGNGKKGRYIMIWKLPAGDHNHEKEFPNNAIDYVSLPFGVVVELFKGDNFKGETVVLTGTDSEKNTRYELKEIGFHDQVSSIRVSSVGQTLDDASGFFDDFELKW